MFFLISLVIIWLFALHPIQRELQFSRVTSTVKGTLSYVGLSTASASVSAFNRNRSQPIYACHFNFPYQGRTINGISYMSSSHPPLAGIKEVPVEFVPGKPEAARINLPGYRSTQMDPWALVSIWFGWPVLMMPLLGLILWGFGIMQGLKLLHLLKHARLGQAQLVRQTDTGTNKIVNGESFPIHKLIFAYEVSGKLYETEFKTHEVSRLTDEPREDLLFLPNHPNLARLEDTLPDWIERRDGSYQSTKPLQNYFELLIPTFLVLVILYMAFQ